ncbi:MAG TPA: glycosyltransferase family 9 protein [Gammaproteobacteria bacterium]|nr:glycosyltransferase family 9 protein [Gammaproteobacteria bacterium]
MGPDTVEKILIIKTGALGDVIIATGPIRRIMENHANDEIWLLTAPAYRGIFNTWDNLHVISFKRRGICETIKTIRWIRRGSFRRVYDLQSNDRTALLCLLSSIPERVGNHPRLPYTLHPPLPYDRTTPIFRRLHEVLDAAGLGGKHLLPELPVSMTDRQYVQEFIEDINLPGGRIVLIHAGASERHPQKCWPHFLSLAIMLEQHGYRVLWTGSADERASISHYVDQAGMDISGRFTINQLAELGKHAVFALTNDSGPMHILATAGIPVYAFFGPTNWRRHHAVGQEQYVIAAGNNSQGTFSPAPLEQITVEDVARRLQRDGWLPAA